MQVNEEYIGKLPELVKISKYFDNMLLRASRIPNKMNPNKWPENAQIQATICKLFGLKRFVLHWSVSAFGDASTYPDSALFGEDICEAMTQAIRQKGRGFYDTKHQLVFLVFVSTGLLHPNMKMTGPELTATILHEIGHNFDYSLASYSKAVRELYTESIMSGINKRKLKYQGDIGDVDSPITDMVDTYAELKREQLDMVKYRDSFWYDHQKSRNFHTWHQIETMKEYLNDKAEIIANAFYTAKDNIKMMLSKSRNAKERYYAKEGRRAEQFADSFATCYGYGPELISAFNKFSDQYTNMVEDTSRVGKLIRDFDQMNAELNQCYVDEHGTTQSRCKDCIRKLRQDLSSGDYSPEAKSALMDEINKLEDEYNTLVNCDPEFRVSFTRGFRKFIDKFFNGQPEFKKKSNPHYM